ncbi:MAG: hypothetical protein ACOCRX_09985, partial [Candidatus Woesearchaeota archaeon]
LYYKVFEENKGENFLRDVLKNRILKPLNNNVLYELYVFFNILDVIEGQGWKLKSVNLIGGNSESVSVYSKNNETIKIYYQNLPKKLKEKSIYGNYLDFYDLNCRSRRPDVIIEKDSQKYCIIEVKRSANRGYIVDGVYKLMGYLKDFEKRVTNGVSGVKGILTAWELPGNERINFINKQELLLADHNTFKDLVEKIL